MQADPLTAFIEAACAPLDHGHASGTLERAAEILAAHPEIAQSNVYAASIVGDDTGVRRFLAADSRNATGKGGPRGWDALTYLCFSRYLRLDRARSEGFVRAARALLDAGASANTGFHSGDDEPPELESVLYGAAGVAHHAELTRLLLDRGADPNDGETVYHSPETHDNGALAALVESGKLTEDSLAAMLVRKADWHDQGGITYLLERGADPNRMTRWGYTALHQALRRDNALANIEVMLGHGADPTLKTREGRSAVAIAARRGRGDVLASFERRGIPIELHGVERLAAACARSRAEAIGGRTAREPVLVQDLLSQGGTLLAEFAGVGNTGGVGHLLDLGVDPKSPYAEGDGYFGIARNGTALHVAAWRARHATVKLLIQRGAPVDVRDGKGRTPLALAVRACVDSFWTHLRSPESVQALLDAGAAVTDVAHPSGYADVDELLRSHGR